MRTLAPFVALSCVIISGRPATGLQLDAKLDLQKDQIHVELRNEQDQTYLAAIGSLCGPKGNPGFGFTLQRKGQKDEALVLNYNGDGKACSVPSPWVTVLTKDAQYGFDFLIRELHFRQKPGLTLADIPPDSPYTLVITYRGAVDPVFVKNWGESSINQIPFWIGALSITVSKPGTSIQ